MSTPAPAPTKLTTEPLAEPSTAPTPPETTVDDPAFLGPVPDTALAPAPCTQVAKTLSDAENWTRMMSPLIERYGR